MCFLVSKFFIYVTFDDFLNKTHLIFKLSKI